MAIKRDELLAKKGEITAKMQEIEKKQKKVRYITNRYYEGVGVVSEMDEPELVAALKDLKDRFKEDTEYDQLSQELGLPVRQKKEDDDEPTYLGYTYDEWMEDFKTRAAYLNNEATLDKLDEALEIIERNLSEEDKFNLEMQALEELL
jgi:hypothetical protein